jgi:hypothetical protein
VYNITVNLENNATSNIVFNEFDYETKVKLLGERRAKKGKDVKPLYNIHTIIEKNDGGLIVLSEYQTVFVGQKQGIGPLGIQSVIYTMNEIIVTCLKPDGTLEWSNVVAKEQQAGITVASFNIFGVGGSGSFNVAIGLSIPLAVMGKGITDIEQIKALGNYNNAVPTLFVFDNKGAITRKDPEEVIKNELVLRPGIFNRVSDNEYIIYASRKSLDKLGRMILQD